MKNKKGATKLDPNKVKVIQSLFQFSEIKDHQIADLFDVSREQINHIRNGHRWGDITGIKREEKQTNFNDALDKQIRSNDFREFTDSKSQLKKNMKEALMHFIARF